jgi:hypothetical protein
VPFGPDRFVSKQEVAFALHVVLSKIRDWYSSQVGVWEGYAQELKVVPALERCSSAPVHDVIGID